VHISYKLCISIQLLSKCSYDVQKDLSKRRRAPEEKKSIFMMMPPLGILIPRNLII